MSNKKIILALDNLEFHEIKKMVTELNDRAIFKINDAYIRYGQQIINHIHELGGEIFLDLKFHDIPNTIANLVKVAADLEIFMFNIHCLGGFDMMKLAAETLYKHCKEKNLRRPILLGVTILTSINEKTLIKDLNITTKNTKEMVKHLAKMAQRAGLDGVVCSPQEINIVKQVCGTEFITVTPGIRPKWAISNDQKRITTPKQAIKLGTNYLVIGRPITQAKNYDLTRNGAMDKICKEIF